MPPSPPPAIPPLPSSIGGANSLYQPLTPTTSSTGGRINTEYAGLNELTREPSQPHFHSPVSPHSSSSSLPAGQGAEYMGLSFTTRNQPESAYMDLNVSKT